MNPTLERAIGRLLRPIRAGELHLAWNDHRLQRVPDSITLKSSAFKEGDPIPSRYAAGNGGDNISPPLEWSGLPSIVRDLVLIVQDLDSPFRRPIVQLIAMGLPAKAGEVAEGALNPPGSKVHFGRGSFGRLGYSGPRPIRGHGPHRYVFQVFALSERLVFTSATPDLATTLDRLSRSVIAKGRLTGTYEQV